MTRTDVVASSRPQAVGAPSMKIGSPRALRRLLVLPVALLLGVALVAPTMALGATETGYSQTPPPPTTPATTTPATTTPATTTPATTTPPATSGTSPSKEATTPEKAVAPAKASSAPTTESSKTLPFTGFDLRWTVGIGLLLMGVGFSLVTIQRRQRRDTDS
jgi:hypothetical protein